PLPGDPLRRRRAGARRAAHAARKRHPGRVDVIEWTGRDMKRRMPGPRPLLLPLLLLLLGDGACTAGPLDVGGVVPGSLLTGLVAHWSFDEGSGTTTADGSGNRRDGTLSGAATWIPGRFGNALHFTEGGGVTVPSFPEATSSWSVALWARVPKGDFGAEYVT